MKGKFKALVMSGVLVLSLAAVSPVTAFAADASTGAGQSVDVDPAYASPTDPTDLKDKDGQSLSDWGTVEVPVNAEVVGSSDKIIYSVNVEYGAMNFSYDFGQTWDPETHTYSVKKTDQISGGWVVKKCIDGKNNAITVTNNSNYPIHAAISYSQAAGANGGTIFNKSSNNTNSVVGIFSADNDTLASHINDSDYNGLHATKVNAMLTYDFDLDMDYSKLTLGEYDDYGVLPKTNANFTKFSKTIYFALCGTPDSTLAVTDGYVPVGSIKLVITPVPKEQTVMRNALDD